MKRLCIVGGISTAGKSTLVQQVIDKDPEFLEFNKFHESLRREFSNRGIELGDALKYWEPVARAASDKYVQGLSEEKVSIMDIHYAVQPDYDLNVHRRVSSNHHTNEPYSCGVDAHLINKLVDEGTEVVTVLVYAPLSDILSRRGDRLVKTGIARSLDPENILEEMEKESLFFKQVNARLKPVLRKSFVLKNDPTRYDSNRDSLEKDLKAVWGYL